MSTGFEKILFSPGNAFTNKHLESSNSFKYRAVVGKERSLLF
jgi:hypothetical protein